MTREDGFEGPGRQAGVTKAPRDDLWLELLKSAVRNANRALGDAHAAGWDAVVVVEKIYDETVTYRGHRVRVTLTKGERRIEVG